MFYFNNLYFYVGDFGLMGTSTDAITWTSRMSGTSTAIYALTYGNGLYVTGDVNRLLATSKTATIIEYSTYYDINTQFYVPTYTLGRQLTLPSYGANSAVQYVTYVRAR